MALSASPFHCQTGELLPIYRDAYLRGDLSTSNTQAVDAYLAANPQSADAALTRFHAMQQAGQAVKPVGWVRQQFELVRTEPRRLRRRAGTLAASVALVASAVFAGTNLPTETPVLPDHAAGLEAEATGAAVRLVTVKGRILDENGRPLVGATVLDKATGRGAGTDGQGYYTLRLPATQARQLQFGYGGYADEEIQLRGQFVQNVTLLPRETQEQPVKQKRRWLLF